MEERLQKILARAGYGSRRKCEEFIAQRRVRVNGKLAELGTKANPATDTITIDGNKIREDEQPPRYIVFNKPKNVLSTNKPQHGDTRATVREMVQVPGHLFTIGRLDADSEGLMILTNDGDLKHQISHPSFENTKTYKVILSGSISDESIRTWEQGIWLDNSRTSACSIEVLNRTKKISVIRIVMIEGRKRQIRRIANILGHHVISLIRTHIGQLGLGTLKRGTWYELDNTEIEALLIPDPAIARIHEVRQERRKQKKLQTND